jgi:hypothetical protein
MVLEEVPALNDSGLGPRTMPTVKAVQIAQGRQWGGAYTPGCSASPEQGARHALFFQAEFVKHISLAVL